jgi:hypothetical protein
MLLYFNKSTITTAGFCIVRAASLAASMEGNGCALAIAVVASEATASNHPDAFGVFI